MEKRHGNQTIGIILILLGIYWAFRSLGMFHFRIFFDGWWTLFIIVPCLVGLKQGKSRAVNIVGILIGAMLLLWRQGWIEGSYIPAVFVALIFILIGVSIMFGGSRQHSRVYEQNMQDTQYYQQDTTQQTENLDNRSASYAEYSYGQNEGFRQQDTYQEADGNQEASFYSTFETCPPNVSAILVGKSVSCLRGIFRGTNIQSILGNIQLDLRQAQLETDVYVNVSLILGGADIYLPDNVRVICETQSILGDVRDIRTGIRCMDQTVPAIHITGSCVLGGLELK